MRNLIAFYLRFRIFLVFAVLQGVALFTYFRYSEFPRLQFMTSAAGINASVLEARNEVTKHFHLSTTNRRLEWENKQLRERLKESLYRENKGEITINDTAFKQQYTYIPATVINNTYDKRNNYMTIDIGSNEGIKRGQGVISSKGVVGTVHNVTDHFAVVRTVLTKNINIDVMLAKGGAFGLLKWDGLNPRRVSITGISNDMRIKIWAEVVTRGGSGIFPRGIPVGKVRTRKSMEGKPLWDISVLLAEDFRNIQHVYVVKNLMLEELQQLEEGIPADKEEEELQ